MEQTVCANVPPPLYEAVKSLCRVKNQSLSDFFRDALIEKLDVEAPDLYKALLEGEEFNKEIEVHLEKVVITLNARCFEKCDKVGTTQQCIPFEFECIDWEFNEKRNEVQYIDCMIKIPKWMAKVLERDEAIEGWCYCPNSVIIEYELILEEDRDEDC